MSENLFNLSPLLDQLQTNQLILTPNSRLRRKIIDAYNEFCRNNQQSTWQAPRVYAYSEWITETHQQLLDEALLKTPKVVANESQLQQLWLQIITDDDSGAELINPLKLASDASAALKSLQRWRLSQEELQQHSDADTILLRWLSIYQSQLSELGFCTVEDVQEEIITACLNGHLEQESHLILLGFEQPAPLLTEVISTLSSSHTHLPALPNTPANSCLLSNCASIEEEIYAAALWALHHLQQNSKSSIGIISPDLGQSRDIIERIFIEVFEPHYSLPESPRYTLPFNFSAGIPLGKVPLVHDTLELLKLNQAQWSIEKVLDLLNSPFWVAANDFELQYQISSKIKSKNREYIRAAQFRYICHQLAEQEYEDGHPS